MRPSNDPAERLDWSLDTLIPTTRTSPDIKYLIVQAAETGEFSNCNVLEDIVIGFCRWKDRLWAWSRPSRWCCGSLESRAASSRALRGCCDASTSIVTYVTCRFHPARFMNRRHPQARSESSVRVCECTGPNHVSRARLFGAYGDDLQHLLSTLTRLPHAEMR